MASTQSADSDEGLYFDDLQIGQRFISGEHLVDEAQITTFARQFDPQPFHMGTEGVKESFFGELVASGWHTAAITMRLMVEHGVPIAGGLVGAGAEITWPNPTRPGSILHVESEVVDLRSSRSRPDRGIATMRSETRDQHGNVLQILTAKLIMRRKVPDASSGNVDPN